MRAVGLPGRSRSEVRTVLPRRSSPPAREHTYQCKHRLGPTCQCSDCPLLAETRQLNVSIGSTLRCLLIRLWPRLLQPSTARVLGGRGLSGVTCRSSAVLTSRPVMSSILWLILSTTGCSNAPSQALGGETQARRHLAPVVFKYQHDGRERSDNPSSNLSAS